MEHGGTAVRLPLRKCLKQVSKVRYNALERDKKLQLAVGFMSCRLSAVFLEKSRAICTRVALRIIAIANRLTKRVLVSCDLIRLFLRLTGCHDAAREGACRYFIRTATKSIATALAARPQHGPLRGSWSLMALPPSVGHPPRRGRHKQSRVNFTNGF